MTRVDLVGFMSLLKHRDLVIQLVRREVRSRYSGSVLGVFWSFVNPLVMLLVYTFVFGTVFQSRWGSSDGVLRSDYTVLLFVGMLVHGCFAECLSKSATLIVSNSNYVKKVVFPLEILPWTIIGAAYFHFAAGLIMLFVVQFITNGALEWSLFFLPIIIVPFALFLAGLSWIVSSLGVYFRDIAQLISMVITLMMFLSPVFYSVESIPKEYQSYMQMNPLTQYIEQMRAILVFNRPPDISVMLEIFLIAIFVAIFGNWFFKRTKKGFADVL